jgi:hypothetical protein
VAEITPAQSDAIEEARLRALAAMTRQEAHRRLGAVHEASLECQRAHRLYSLACARGDGAEERRLRGERDRASGRLSRAQAALDDALRAEWGEEAGHG